MRRLAVVLGTTATLAGAVAAPAAAHTITPTSFDFGTFGLRQGAPSQQFAVTLTSSLDADPRIINSGNVFGASADTSVPASSRCGNGTMGAGVTCYFRVSFRGSDRPGSFSATVTVGGSDEGGPTATVTARTAANPSKGKKKKCKKKGKKSAAAAKKKCGKKGKK